MKPVLLIVAACAALLCALPAQAKLFHRRAAEVRVAVSVAPQAVAQPQVVRYQQGERRLRPGERIKARLAANKAIRELRVPTVVSPAPSITLSVESSGTGE